MTVKTRVKRKRSQVRAWFSGAAGRSLVFALLLALPWTGANGAFALTAGAQAPQDADPVYQIGEALNPEAAAALPVTLIDERPSPKAATAKGASRIYGSQLNLSLNVNSTLAGSVFFSKSLPLYEALRSGNIFGYREEAPGLLALRGSGAEHVLDHGRAVQQKLDYSTAAFRLQGSYMDVDESFSTPGAGSVQVIGDRSSVDALAALRGMKELQFQSQYQPGGALSLTTGHRRSVNDQPGHKEIGRSVTEDTDALVYQLSGDRQLALNYHRLDEQWTGKGPMQIESLAATLKPTSRMQLTYSRDSSVNQREGHKEKGLTRDDSKQGLTYQFSGQTRLEVNYQQLRDAWDRGDKVEVTEKDIRDYALHHAFSGSTKADLVRNFTSVTSGGATTDIETTQLHFEHKPGGRLNLAADWLDRNRSDGGTEDLTSLALDSTIGSGRGKLALTGLYRQHSEGANDKQVDTLYKLGLATAPSPLLQLNANYESFRQQGPNADHDFVRTQLGLASQLHRYAKLTADYAQETDKGAQTRADRGIRLDLNPGRLSLSSGIALQERQGQPDLSTTFADLQIKFGRPLADWAKALGGADPLPGAVAYGFRGRPGWAGIGDGALTLNYVSRSTDGQPNVVTRSLGYQTMLGRRAYVKLAMHTNPMVKKDDKLVMQAARWDVYEGGLDLSNGFAAISRFIREEDLSSGAALSARASGLRGAVGGGDRVTFFGGLQSLRPEGASPTDWQFANLNVKFGRPLADWAKNAGNGGLFDDSEKYGYRKLPAWASFADGGLSLRYMSRDAQGGEKLIASAVGYQTMLGGRTYLRLSFQQNPLTDKGQVIPVDRKLYELGRRIGGKFVVLARYLTDDNLTESKSLRTNMLGFRGRLSERERLETVIVLDNVVSQGDRYRTTTYGLEYAREAGEGHYFIIKGTLSHGDAPGGSVYGPDVYQVDFAYQKEI